MSDQSRPHAASTPGEAGETPSPEELEKQAVPASLRVAPRFGRVVGTGVVAGIVLGVVCALVLPNSTSVSLGMVMLLLCGGFALLGGTIGGVIAATLDRETPNYLKKIRAAETEPEGASAPNTEEPQ